MTNRETLLQGQPSSAPASPVSPADDRATEFKAVEGSTGEQYSGYALLVEAYAALWLILMAWIYLLWRKQAALGGRLDGLEAAIDRAATAAATAAKGDKAAKKAE